MRFALALSAAVVALVSAAGPPLFTLDRAGERWVEQTRAKMTLDEKIGQLIVPSFNSSFLSTDSDKFDELARLVRDYHVGGFHVFGAFQPMPGVLLNASYGTVLLGQPLEAASTLNRLQDAHAGKWGVQVASACSGGVNCNWATLAANSTQAVANPKQGDTYKASAWVKGKQTTTSTPQLWMIDSFLAVGVISTGQRSGAKSFRGCGSKVSTSDVPPIACARWHRVRKIS